jgi:hypothetical protein
MNMNVDKLYISNKEFFWKRFGDQTQGHLCEIDPKTCKGFGCRKQSNKPKQAKYRLK